MSAPSITFYTSSATITGNTPPNSVYDMTKLGAMATVFDFGTIDTGSSGSNTWFWIFNNIGGSASIADAILSSSTSQELGLGHHESGSTGHNTESSYSWSLQSGSFTGSVYATSYYQLTSGAGNKYTSGSLTSPSGLWTAIYSGSSGQRLLYPSPNATASLSGSTGLGGNSGSGWLVGVWIYVQNGVAQGTKTGSLCVKYKYV